MSTYIPTYNYSKWEGISGKKLIPKLSTMHPDLEFDIIFSDSVDLNIEGHSTTFN